MGFNSAFKGLSADGLEVVGASTVCSPKGLSRPV